MKRTYQKPIVDLQKYTEDEILTDLISASAPTASGASSMSWEDFVNGIY